MIKKNAHKSLTNNNIGSLIFDFTNNIVLFLFCLTILIPFWYLFVQSIDNYASPSGSVYLWPLEFTLGNYKMVLRNKYIGIAYLNTIFRTVLGTILSLFFTSMGAYAISKKRFPNRVFWSIFIIFTMFFSGGLIPTYLWISKLKLPVFADLDLNTYNMTAESIEKKITNKTKAILIVHLTGNPSDMDPILDLAKKHGIMVIEDCAQAYYAYYKGRLLGTIGDIGCFSLNDFKHISAGDGGMVLLNNEELYRRALCFTDKNYDRLANDPLAMRKVPFLAPNYRMTELQRAVALGQLERVEGICKRHSQIGDAITKAISGIDGIIPPKTLEGCKSSYWFYLFRIDEKKLGVDREEFVKALNAEGIPAQAGYIPCCVYDYDILKNHNAYEGNSRCPFECTFYGKEIDYNAERCINAEIILNTSIRIGISQFYTDKDVEDISKAIIKVSKWYLNSQKKT